MEDQSHQASRTRRPSLIRELIEDPSKQGLVRGSRFCARLVVQDRYENGVVLPLTLLSYARRRPYYDEGASGLTRQCNMITLEVLRVRLRAHTP
jgi:hypothetical protein